MKRLILTLICLLPLSAFGQAITGNSAATGNAAFGSAVSGGGGDCSTSDSTLLGDELKYGYESGDTATWATYTSVSVLTYDESYDSSSLSQNKQTGQCDVAGHYILSGTAGVETRYADLGATKTHPIDINFYLYPESVVEDGVIVVFEAGNSTTPESAACVVMYMRNIAGTYSVAADGITTSAYLTITANQWNLVTLHLDSTASSSSISVNGGAAETFQRTTQGVRYLHIGAVAGHGAGETATWDVDVLCVNTP